MMIKTRRDKKQNAKVQKKRGSKTIKDFVRSPMVWIVTGGVIILLVISGIVVVALSSNRQEPMLDASDRPPISIPSGDRDEGGDSGTAPDASNQDQTDSADSPASPQSDNPDQPTSNMQSDAKPQSQSNSDGSNSTRSPDNRNQDIAEEQPCEPQNIGEMIGSFLGRVVGSEPADNC